MRILKVKLVLILSIFLQLQLGAQSPDRSTIYLDSCGIHAFGHTLQPGQDTSAWVAALGKPSRRKMGDTTSVWTFSWDHLGMTAMIEEKQGDRSKVNIVFLFFRNLEDREGRKNVIGDIFSSRYRGHYSRAEQRRDRALYGDDVVAGQLWGNDPRHYIYTYSTLPKLRLDGMPLTRRSQIEDINASRTRSGRMPFWYKGTSWVLFNTPSNAEALNLPVGDTRPGYYETRSGGLCEGHGWWMSLYYSNMRRLYYVVLNAYSASDISEFQNMR